MIKIKLKLEAKFALFMDIYAIVDDDQSHLAELEWKVKCVSGFLYPYHSSPTKDHKTLHREVVGNPTGMHVHHVNGNTLDNRRSNLQILTAEEHSKIKKRSKKAIKQNALLIPIS